MKRIKITELKELVEKAYRKAEASERAFEGDPNPQTRELYLLAKGRAEAYRDVLCALDGDKSNLRISATDLF
jgi:hypothetical protein